MAILKKATPGALGSNMIQFTTNEQICCGQTPEEANCYYYASIALGTSIRGVSIGGTSYWFASPIIVSDGDNQQAIVDAIKEATREAGYTNNDIIGGWNATANAFEIFIGPSAVAFSHLELTSGFTQAFDEGCGDYEAQVTITSSDIPYGAENVDLQLFDNEDGLGTPLQRVTGDAGGLVNFTNLLPNTSYWVNCIMTEDETPSILAVVCADTPVLKKFTTNFVGQITWSDDWAVDAEYPIIVTLIP